MWDYYLGYLWDHLLGLISFLLRILTYIRLLGSASHQSFFLSFFPSRFRFRLPTVRPESSFFFLKHSHSTSPASLSDFPPVFRFISRFRYFRRPLRYLLIISQNTCHTSYRFLRYLCPVSIFVESRVPQVSSLVEHWLSAWLLLSLASFRFASSSRSCESRHEVSLKSKFGFRLLLKNFSVDGLCLFIVSHAYQWSLLYSLASLDLVV